MRYFGLIGYPLGHSFSKKYFTEKFEREKIDAHYDLYPLTQIEEFNLLNKKVELSGLNVTIPYKERIIPFLHELDQTAAEIGAVNVIKFIRTNGECYLKGYNTDAIGFIESMRPHLTGLSQQTTKGTATTAPRALVFGTGGAAKAVAYGLRTLGVEVQFVSRQKKENSITYADLTPEVFATHSVLVNATPLGTFPNVDECIPIDFAWVGPQHVVFDVVYNPEETLFLQQGRKQGATTINGLGMLHEQAKAAWTIWNL